MIAIRPPEYFPRLAYLALMEQVECFVLADTFQYSRQSFQNRTRVRNPDAWQWLTVPLKGGQHGKPFKEVNIRRSVLWEKKHWRALFYNYRSSPYFEHYEHQIDTVLSLESLHLLDITKASIELLKEAYGIRTPLLVASELDAQPATLPGIIEQTPYELLVSPMECAAVDAQVVQDQTVFSYTHPSYRQTFDGFVPEMSAVDLLFNYGPEARNIMLSGSSPPEAVNGRPKSDIL